MSARNYFCGIAASLLAVNGLQAALAWATTEQSLSADPTRSEISASFTFRNAASSPITITDIHTSCGCTAATLQKKTYAPGESGKVDVVLHYTGDVSPIQQTVTVTTDAADAPSHELKLEVVIPQPARRPRIDVQPHQVHWTRGAAVQSRVVNLRITNPDDALRPVAVTASDAAFRVDLRPPRVDEPFLYELVITPLTLDAAREAVITIGTNSERLERGGAPLSYRITATID